MNSAICTLFEGHYHYGVAALINSLYNNQFRGDIYIGYKGDLPPWAKDANNDHSDAWVGASTLQVVPNLVLHFLPLVTDVHLTNYKPRFMLEVWDKYVKKVDLGGIFYFDPDIVIKCGWDFYEKWITYGVALVHEIVRNDMPPTHPKRLQWIPIADSLGLTVKNNLKSQINAGFVGVNKSQLDFLRMWCDLIDHSSTYFDFDTKMFFQSTNAGSMFSVGDQDLLNLTAMCTEEKLSEFGPEGMDFINGGRLMSHSTGSPKPWKINFMKAWLKGNGPSLAMGEYWRNANGIINCYSNFYLKRKRFLQKFASILARFYSKS